MRKNKPNYMKRKAITWSIALVLGIGSTLFFSFSYVQGSDLFEITKNLSAFSLTRQCCYREFRQICQIQGAGQI